MIPDNVEKIIMTKEDYDRNVEQLLLDKCKAELEVERLNNIIDEQDKELELERKSRQLLTDDLANVCEMSLKKENIIKEVREYIESYMPNYDFDKTNLIKLLEILDKGE